MMEKLSALLIFSAVLCCSARTRHQPDADHPQNSLTNPGVVFSGTNQRPKRHEPLNSFNYLATVKINSSSDTISERLKKLLQGYTFPYGDNKLIRIARVNLTSSAPSKSFKYLIDIKINASKENVIDRLRTLLHGYPRDNISMVNISTGRKISRLS
ncbi:hypothetical protein AOLI_G00066880 [Acnodon oligacanthus]